MATISELTPAEYAWIADQLTTASQFVSAHGPGDELTLETLDRAWANWLRTEETDTQQVNQVINAVGIAFGQALSETTPLRWVIAEDENGTDLALFAFPGKGDVLVYPANLIAKRWESRQAGFLAGVYEAISEQVNNLALSPPTASKPWWKLW